MCLLMATFAKKKKKKIWKWREEIELTLLYMWIDIHINTCFYKSLFSQFYYFMTLPNVLIWKTQIFLVLLNKWIWYCLSHEDRGYVSLIHPCLYPQHLDRRDYNVFKYLLKYYVSKFGNLGLSKWHIQDWLEPCNQD